MFDKLFSILTNLTTLSKICSASWAVFLISAVLFMSINNRIVQLIENIIVLIFYFYYFFPGGLLLSLAIIIICKKNLKKKNLTELDRGTFLDFKSTNKKLLIISLIGSILWWSIFILIINTGGV